MNYTDTTGWALVATIGWGTKTCDTDAVKQTLLRTLTVEQAVAFQDWVSNKEAALHEAFEHWLGEREAGLGDDGYWDMMSHMVGLGQEAYEAALANPQLVYDRAQWSNSRESWHARSNDMLQAEKGYVEKFAYCIPYESDYAMAAPGGFRSWGEDIKTRAEAASRFLSDNLDYHTPADVYDTILEALHVIVMAAEKAVEDDVSYIIDEMGGDLTDAAQDLRDNRGKVIGTYEHLINWRELVDGLDVQVDNLLSDVRLYRAKDLT